MGKQTNGGGAAHRAGAINNPGRRGGGRFIGTGNLTGKQRKFVKEYVRNGGRGPAALRVAGYDYRNPSVGVRELLERDHVAEAIRKERQAVLECEAASRSLDVMRSLLTEPDTPASVRFQAARWVLEQTAEPPSAREDAQSDLPLTEMTLDELQRYIAEGSELLDMLRNSRNNRTE